MVYTYIYVVLLEIQKLNMLLFIIEIILHWEVILGIFNVKLWLIIEIILQLHHLENYKGTAQMSRKILDDFFGVEIEYTKLKR